MKTIFQIIKVFSIFLLTFLILESCANRASTNASEKTMEGDTVEPPAPTLDPVPVEPKPVVVPNPNSPTTGGSRPDKSEGDSQVKPNTANRMFVMPSFPFPPPKASASHTFEQNVFSKAKNLYEVSELIEGALKKGGYYEKSYYKIPNGFALVTRMEKMKSDGSPAVDEERWNVNNNNTGSGFDLMSYFKSLFVAADGHYRIIVFMITPENMRQTEEEMTMAEAKKYLTKGYSRLPSDFKNIPFTDDYSCSALIYEWYKVENEEPQFMEPSKFLGRYHLAKNRFVEHIGEE